MGQFVCARPEVGQVGQVGRKKKHVDSKELTATIAPDRF